MARTNLENNHKPEGNPFVAIGASLAGILLATTLFFLIFAKDSIEFLVPIAWAFVVLGVVLGFFAYLSIKSKK